MLHEILPNLFCSFAAWMYLIEIKSNATRYALRGMVGGEAREAQLAVRKPASAN